jgi:hypothetical protein
MNIKPNKTALLPLKIWLSSKILSLNKKQTKLNRLQSYRDKLWVREHQIATKAILHKILEICIVVEIPKFLYINNRKLFKTGQLE